MTEKKSEEKKAYAVNINKIIKKRNGDPIRQSPRYTEGTEFCEECAKKVNAALGDPVTVKSIIVDLLDSMPKSTPKGEKVLSGSEKLRRGLLAEKIYNSMEPVELPVEDLALIKKLVGDVQTPLVVSQVLPEIDPKSVKE